MWRVNLQTLSVREVRALYWVSVSAQFSGEELNGDEFMQLLTLPVGFSTVSKEQAFLNACMLRENVYKRNRENS